MDSFVWNLTNIIARLILPPTILFILIAVGVAGGTKRLGRWLAGISLTCLVIISVPAVSNALLAPVEALSPPLTEVQFSTFPKAGATIVVLGGGRRKGAREYPDWETLSGPSIERCRYASRLARITGLPVSVSGGKPTGGVNSEGSLMKNFIQAELNQPVAFIEDKSMDTRQSALLMAKILLSQGIHTVILVTDVLHILRASHAFEAAGFRVIRAPTGFQSAAELSPADYLPTPAGLGLSAYLFHEALGEAWYTARRLVERLSERLY